MENWKVKLYVDWTSFLQEGDGHKQRRMSPNFCFVGQGKDGKSILDDI